MTTSKLGDLFFSAFELRRLGNEHETRRREIAARVAAHNSEIDAKEAELRRVKGLSATWESAGRETRQQSRDSMLSAIYTRLARHHTAVSGAALDYRPRLTDEIVIGAIVDELQLTEDIKQLASDVDAFLRPEVV